MGGVVDEIVPELRVEIRKALIEGMTLTSELRNKTRGLIKVFSCVEFGVEERND